MNAPMSVLVKICGLKSFDAIDAAIDAGADMVGFVFFRPSPRHVDYTDARNLARHVADRILFDAKPPRSATRPGGNGAAFDWSILDNLDLDKPWMLSGGLTVENV